MSDDYEKRARLLRLLEHPKGEGTEAEILREARFLFNRGQFEFLTECSRRAAGEGLEIEASIAEFALRGLWKLGRVASMLEFVSSLSGEAQRSPPIVLLRAKALNKMRQPENVVEYLRSFPELTRTEPEFALVFEQALVKSNRRRELVTHLQRVRDLVFPHDLAVRREQLSPRVMEYARRYLGELDADRQWTESGVHHIAILGQSYCGSTILGAVLGSLEGVDNIGESFWLTHRKTPGGGLIRNFGNLEDQEGIQYCTTCGPECRVFPPEFREQLARDPRLWYLKIVSQLGSRTLVSSDKNLSKVEKTDPLFRFDAIVLFKSPEQHWWSNLKKIRKRDPKFMPVATLEAFMRRWTQDHAYFLEQLEPRGKKLFLCFDEFCRRPALHLERLVRHLGLPFYPRTLENVDPNQHFFGGNALVSETYQSGTVPLKVKPLPPALIPESDRERIAGNSELQAVWSACMKRYRAAFAGL